MVRDKPTSIRLPSELLEEIDTMCQDEGCSRNDKITSLIEYALNPEENHPEPIIKEVIKEVPVEKIIEKVVEKPVIKTEYKDRIVYVQVPTIEKKKSYNHCDYECSGSQCHGQIHCDSNRHGI